MCLIKGQNLSMAEILQWLSWYASGAGGGGSWGGVEGFFLVKYDLRC